MLRSHPSSSRAIAAADLPPRDPAAVLSAPPGDRDWPGVSAVRALAEATLSGADAEAVRRAKLELVQRRNADRARVLADMLDAEVRAGGTGWKHRISRARSHPLSARQASSPGPAPRRPPPSAFQQAVAQARSKGAGGESLALPAFPEPEPRAAAAPPVSMDEKRRAMRMRLMQQLGEEARESVRHVPEEGKGAD